VLTDMIWASQAANILNVYTIAWTTSSYVVRGRTPTKRQPTNNTHQQPPSPAMATHHHPQAVHPATGLILACHLDGDSSPTAPPNLKTKP